jgi:hypothetical protein
MPIVLKITLALQLAIGFWAIFSPASLLTAFRRRPHADTPRAELSAVRLLGIAILIVTIYWYLAFIRPRFGWW